MASPADAFDRRNLLTYASLLCGVAAVAAANAHHAHMAGLAIAAAVIADTFDGRFARRFGTDPRRCALGVGARQPGRRDRVRHRAAALFRAAAERGDGCSGLRAVGRRVRPRRVRGDPARVLQRRCNVEAAACSPKAKGEAEGFVGIPVPLAALIWSTALLVQPSAAVTTGVILATAAAMVLPIRVPRPTGAGLVLFTCWPLSVALCHLAFAIWH